MENAAKLIAVTFLSLFLVACGGDETPQKTASNQPAGPRVDRVSLVSDGDFTLQGKPAVTVYLGDAGENYAEITVFRSNVRAGYAATSVSSNNPELSVSATWGGTNYVQSSKHATEAAFKIVSITPTEAVVEFGAKLINPSTGAFLTLKPSAVKVEGEMFKRLTAN